MATDTRYRNTNGTGGMTTSYAYTWQGTTNQIYSRATSLPIVSTLQNGPGIADVTTTVFDAFNRLIWKKDADGYIFYTAYDDASGAVA